MNALAEYERVGQCGRRRASRRSRDEFVLSKAIVPKSYTFDEAPPEIREAADAYAKRFSLAFASLVYFDRATLRCLHEGGEENPPNDRRVVVASSSIPSIEKEIGVLTRCANLRTLTRMDRARYQTALTGVYGKMSDSWPVDVEDEETLFVGIQREGRRLAELMEWLPEGRSIRPHAKRIPYGGGLAVGLLETRLQRAYKGCTIIDGAIASGATLIAVIETLRHNIGRFRIYSVHATAASLHGICRYASACGVEIEIVVGHVSGILNKKFYAVDARNHDSLVVGDLGDTLGPLERGP